jgi:hypothetical protein
MGCEKQWNHFLRLSLEFSYFRHLFKGSLPFSRLSQQVSWRLAHWMCLHYFAINALCMFTGWMISIVYCTLKWVSAFWNYLISFPLQSFTRNYFIFMVRTLQGPTPLTQWSCWSWNLMYEPKEFSARCEYSWLLSRDSNLNEG